MLVPRELDPVAAGARMPLPPQKPAPPAEAKVRTRSTTSSAVQSHSTQLRRPIRGWQDVPKPGAGWTMRNR
jgi:hypothetical protein